jgi:hypothetical protein
LKKALKKETELRHLRRFQQNLLAFPDGMVCVGEAPDFLVNTGHGYIGIEHTQWFRESNNPGGSRMRARESTQDKVLRLASSGYESRGYPPSGSTFCGVSGIFPLPPGFASSQTSWPI